MDRRTFIKSSLAVPLYALVAQGCSSQTDRAKPGRLTTAAGSDMSTMDMAHNDAVYWAQLNMFDRLFETRMIDDKATVVNSLCTDYSVSDDGLTYDFTLREGVLFSNGDPLTSADVCYSFSRLLTEAAVNTDIPLEILGGQALMDKKADTLEGFKIKDETHFSIVLEAPNGGFIAELSSAAMSIVNERTTRKAKNFGKDPSETIGSGPYYAVEWVPNDHFTLRYNERYWGEEPTVKESVQRIIPDASTRDLMFQIGVRRARIILRHILPNCLPTVIVVFTLEIPSSILTESSLSFLGMGVQPPSASWGLMVSAGRAFLYHAPWLCFAPCLAIMAVVLAFNYLGDGLRDVLDPHLQNQ